MELSRIFLLIVGCAVLTRGNLHPVADDINYFRCGRDWCKRGEQFCVQHNDTHVIKTRCEWCRDRAHLCGRPREISRECDSYCIGLDHAQVEKHLWKTTDELTETKEELRAEQLENENKTVQIGNLESQINELAANKKLDTKWFILVSVAAAAFLLLSIVLAVWLCRLSRRSVQTPPSTARNSIKSEDLPNGEGRRLIDNDVALDMENIHSPTTAPQLTQTDQSTSTSSLLQGDDNQPPEGVASRPPGLSVENSGCPGPADICIRNLPDPLKQIAPQEPDSGQICVR